MDFFIEGFTKELTEVKTHNAFAEGKMKVEGGDAGSVEIRGFELPGISIASALGSIVQPVDIVVKYDEEDRNNISFCAPLKTASGISGWLKGMDPYTLKEKHYAFLYYPHETGMHRMGSGDIHFMSFKMNIEKIHEYLHNDELWLKYIVSRIDKLQPAIFSLNATLNVMLENTLMNIVQCPFNGITKRLYLEAKTMEILALSIAALEPIAEPVRKLSERDKRILTDVKRYLDENYLEDLSLKFLCSEFGLNEFKLKAGFKILYGETVFGYIQEQKMQHAYQLLYSGGTNVADLSDILGYNHQGNFAVAFKKRFNVSPLQIRNNKGLVVTR